MLKFFQNVKFGTCFQLCWLKLPIDRPNEPQSHQIVKKKQTHLNSPSCCLGQPDWLCTHKSDSSGRGRCYTAFKKTGWLLKSPAELQGPSLWNHRFVGTVGMLLLLNWLTSSKSKWLATLVFWQNLVMNICRSTPMEEPSSVEALSSTGRNQKRHIYRRDTGGSQTCFFPEYDYDMI